MLLTSGVYKDIGPWMYDILIDIRGIQELYAISVSKCAPQNLLDYLINKQKAQSTKMR